MIFILNSKIFDMKSLKMFEPIKAKSFWAY